MFLTVFYNIYILILRILPYIPYFHILALQKSIYNIYTRISIIQFLIIEYTSIFNLIYQVVFLLLSFPSLLSPSLLSFCLSSQVSILSELFHQQLSQDQSRTLNLPYSISQVLGLQLCTNFPGQQYISVHCSYILERNYLSLLLIIPLLMPSPSIYQVQSNYHADAT